MGIRSKYFLGILEHNYKSFRNVYGQIEYKLAHKIQLPVNCAPLSLMAWYSSGCYILTELTEQLPSQSMWLYSNRQFEQYALLRYLDYLSSDYFEELWVELIADYAKILTRLYDVSIENTHHIRCQSQFFRSFLEWSKTSYVNLEHIQVLEKSNLEIPEYLDTNYRRHIGKHSKEFLYSSFYPLNHWWWHFDT